MACDKFEPTQDGVMTRDGYRRPWCRHCGYAVSLHRLSPFTRRALSRELPALDTTGLVRQGGAL